jgi:hypothetical protein
MNLSPVYRLPDSYRLGKRSKLIMRKLLIHKIGCSYIFNRCAKRPEAAILMAQNDQEAVAEAAAGFSRS